MPIILQKDIVSGVLAVWHIEESIEQLLELVSAEDGAESAKFGAVSRRKEWLAWRALLWSLRPDAQVYYNSIGAPIICDGYIGVTHTKGYAVVMLSDRPCGVDIEDEGRDFSKVANKYISESERLLSDCTHKEFNAAVWCAKEVMYKYAGRTELDFIGDLRIIGCDLDSGLIQGEILGETLVGLHMFKMGQMIIVYTI